MPGLAQCPMLEVQSCLDGSLVRRASRVKAQHLLRHVHWEFFPCLQILLAQSHRLFSVCDSLPEE